MFAVLDQTMICRISTNKISNIMRFDVELVKIASSCELQTQQVKTEVESVAAAGTTHPVTPADHIQGGDIQLRAC